MLRYIGVICIFIFALYIIFSYEKHQRTRLLQAEAFLIFMKLLADELQGLGRPLAACIENFQSEPLEKNGFLPALRAGMLPREGYERVKDRLCLPDALFPILARTFSSLGCASRAEEQRHLAAEILRAEEVLCTEREAQGARLRLCRTLATASAMGLVILLL